MLGIVINVEKKPYMINIIRRVGIVESVSVDINENTLDFGQPLHEYGIFFAVFVCNERIS